MKKPVISLIAAMSENRVIGDKDKIPWHIKEDLVRFKEKTKGHAMIMGRKTFESLLGYYQRSKKPMPKRTTIVVTNNKEYSKFALIKGLVNTYIVFSIEEAIKIASISETKEIFIAGGASIYEQGIKYADKLYLTIVKGKFEGDAFFPDYAEFKKIIAKKDSRDDNYKYTFLDLEK